MFNHSENFYIENAFKSQIKSNDGNKTFIELRKNTEHRRKQGLKVCD